MRISDWSSDVCSSDLHVIVIGAGFGGLAAARGLQKAPVDVTVIDRENHHLFQPLLYQVATAALSPADIAVPIRRMFRGKYNIEVLMEEVTKVDAARRLVHTRRRRHSRSEEHTSELQSLMRTS